ncbi:hypothetical protein SCHPADRAFT_867693, partial [Schizopora paradoxa]
MKLIFGITMILDAFSTIVASGLLGPSFTETVTDSLGAHICPSSANSARQLHSTTLYASPAFIFNTLLLALSASGRLWCYRTLGKQFRYEVSLQEKHRLVTSGPYAFVRHPSYLALYGTYVGSLGLLAARGTWARECAFQAPFSAVLNIFGGTGELTTVERNLAGRLLWEDGLLRDEFGKEWMEYARRVPWRILPFIF